MNTKKEEALANIRNFVKTTPKDVILERLRALASKNAGGIKVSEIMSGCLDKLISPERKRLLELESLAKMLED